MIDIGLLEKHVIKAAKEWEQEWCSHEATPASLNETQDRLMEAVQKLNELESQ